MTMPGHERLASRTKHVYRTEGWVSLLRRALAFALGLLVSYRVYYLYALRLEDIDGTRDAGPPPPMEHVSAVVLSTNEEVDAVEAGGYEFRSLVPDARARLDAGAVATCVFVGKELANIVWVAMTQEAKDSLHEPPFRIDFAGGECWSGDGWTNPGYRRAGLLAYGDVKRRRFQTEQGMRVSRWAVEKGNVPPRRFVEGLGATISAEGRLLRVLWWTSWKENAVPAADRPRNRAQG